MKSIFITAMLFCLAVGSNANPADFLIRSFDVYYQGSEVKITWQTGEVIQNGCFFIERSGDAINFSQIAEFTPANCSSSTFFEIDSKPLNGTSFYRIKQVTSDGFTIYTPIRAIKSYETLAQELNLVSNPCDVSYQNELKKLADEEILVVLRDLEGKEYYSKITLANDECRIEALDKNEVLSKGEYVVTASSKNELYTQVITVK